MSDLSNEKRNPGCLGYKKGVTIYGIYMGIIHPFAPILSACNFWSGFKRVPKHRASKGKFGALWDMNRSVVNLKTMLVLVPSKIEWDLTNGPPRRLLELLNTQV